MADVEGELRQQIGAVRASVRELADYARTLDRNATLRSDPAWSALSTAALAVRNHLSQSLREIGDALAAGDASASGLALTYLESDPYYPGSGYARGRLAGRLSQVKLAEPQSGRARRLVLRVVDGDCHCGLPGLGRLAGSVADNELRRALRERLRSSDTAVARRALRAIVRVRHPGVSPDDLAIARALVLLDASTGWWLSPSVESQARWLWDPQWQSELADTAVHRGPQRVGAKRLLEAAERRRLRRPGP